MDKLLVSLNDRFGDVETNYLLTTSTLLDPRFKDRVFSTPALAKKAKLELKKQLAEVYTNEINANTELVPSIPTKKNTTLYGLILPEKGIDSTPNTPENEFREYFVENIIDIENDIFNYWVESKLNGFKKLSKKYHSCPPGTVASERAFSTAGLTLHGTH